MEEPDALLTAARPAPLTMPSPAELGLGGPAPAAVDWADVRRRMDRVGATGFALQKTAAGFRVTFDVPAAGGARQARGEADAEADAVRQALAQAEAWAGR